MGTSRRVSALIAIVRSIVRRIRVGVPIAIWRGVSIAPIFLVGTSIMFFVTQPWPEHVDYDPLIGIAGIVATVLSLALAVTLLVAQYTAEHHARVIYVEFRRERGWLGALALLGVGVLVITAAALARPTLATGWASLALATGLGLRAASLFPGLLDSLDRTVLADRITNRTVRDLRNVVRRETPIALEPALQPVAKRGIEIAGGMAVEGITTNDREVARAGFAGIRRILVAYVDASPTRGWDTVVIDAAFQNLKVGTALCFTQSAAILILPAVIEELTALGVESQATLPPDGPEAVSGRLNNLLGEVVAQTILNDESAGAAMATNGIGEGALALIRAESPNGVYDHIRWLGSIVNGSLRAEKDHVTGEANRQLARVAIGLAAMGGNDTYPASLFDDACEAISAGVDSFVARTTTKGALLRDYSMLSITGPLAETNLARVILTALHAERETDHPRLSRLTRGATALYHSLVRLSSYQTSVVQTPSNAAETAYMTILGAVTIGLHPSIAELVAEWWLRLVRRICTPVEKENINDVEMLSGLFLVGAYVAVSERPDASKMRDAMKEALGLTAAETNDFRRRRHARAWQNAGRAAVGSGDADLAEAIAKVIAPDLKWLRDSLGGTPWRAYDVPFGPYRGDLWTPIFGLPVPDLPQIHRSAEADTAFNALLDKHDVRRTVRKRRSPPSARG